MPDKTNNELYVKLATCLVWLVLISLFLFGPIGCATAPATPAAYAADAALGARLGTAIYLAERDRLDVRYREAARRAWVAFDALVESQSGESVAPDIRDVLLVQLAAAVPDDAYRPLVAELGNLVLSRVAGRVPLDKLTDNESWAVLVAVHDGIAAVLRANGIDPTVEVE
jgi:hypothetical protein